MLHEAEQMLESGLQIAISVPLREERELLNHKAPIYRLPNELLAEIWSHNYHPLSTSFAWPWLIFPFPMVVSWVTRHWRNVAINTPALWRGIDMSHMTDSLSTVYSVELTDAFIRRSKSCSLDVSILDHRTKTLTDRWAIVAPHVGRCRSLEMIDLYCRSPAETLAMLRPLRDVYAPRLERLEIHYPQGAHSAIIFSGGTPSLSEVRLLGINVRLNSAILTGLKCLHLTNIDGVGRPNHTGFGDLLAASPFLAELSIHGVCVDYTSNPRSQYSTIRSDSLRSLSISLLPLPEDVNFIVLFFSVFLTPSLDYLDLKMKSFALMAFMATLEIAQPKYPLLSQLVLCDYIYEIGTETLDDMLRLIQSSPSIEILELDTSITNHVLSYLTGYDGEDAGTSGEAFWPKLRTLHCPRYFHISPDVLCGFVTKRHSIGMPITKLCLNSTYRDRVCPGGDLAKGMQFSQQKADASHVLRLRFEMRRGPSAAVLSKQKIA